MVEKPQRGVQVDVEVKKIPKTLDDEKSKCHVEIIGFDKTISECKKFWCIIQTLVQISMSVIYQNEYDKFKNEYGNIVKRSVILKGINATVDKVWNVYTTKTPPIIDVRK